MESLSVTFQTYKAMSFTLRFGKATTASNGGYLAQPFCQGHPTTVFCKISVRRSKYCLEFSVT